MIRTERADDLLAFCDEPKPGLRRIRFLIDTPAGEAGWLRLEARPA